MNTLLKRQVEDPVDLAVRHVESVTGILVPEYRRDVVVSALRGLGEGDLLRGLNRVLSEEPAAQRKLFDAVSIPETYFFRHAGHYTVLQEFAAGRLNNRKSCHVLSAGCATGEEAWSAAAVLASVYLPNAGFSVTGWELSEERVATAKAGVYRNWSLRQHANEMQNFLTASGENWVVSPTLRPFTHFYSVNLQGQLWPVSAQRFDVIFFRNVSIYWPRQQAAETVDRLAALLLPGGLFMVGPSDPTSLPRSHWDVQMYNGVCTYRKREIAVKSLPVNVPALLPKAPVTEAAQTRPKKIGYPLPPCLPERMPPANELLRDEISLLADRGEYEKALSRVREAKGQPILEQKYWEGILLLNLDQPMEAVHAFRYCVYLASQDSCYRRWLATALEAAGFQQDASRETRNAERLEME